MFILLNILWVVWEIKYILFWLYLWQLKDYHVGRFADHFRTYKGKKLIFNFTNLIKLALLVLFLIGGPLTIYFFSILFLVYLAEAALFARAILNKSARAPVRTLKIVLLGAISFAILAVFLFLTSSLENFSQAALILVFDILTPVIISAVVLLLQPLFVLLRNNTLRMARDRMDEIKALSGVKTIAITGSYGKTSTKEFLSTILAKNFNVLATKEHQNSEIGIANCILQDLKPSHQVFIAEVGAYNKGKVKEVCRMLEPRIGIVTGVNGQHLALFGSMENLISAEGGGELAAALPDDGLLVVNGDNKYCRDLYKKTNKPKKIYSLSNEIIDSDIWSDSITADKNGISFIAIDKSGEMMHFGVNVLGKQNVQNLLGAILIAKELGMTFGKIAEACKNIVQKQAGMTLVPGKHGIDVVDSSYSANPDGVFADLEYLSVFSGKRIIVMPCLIELGKESAEIHKKIGNKIAQVCDLAIITSKDKFEEIKKGAVDAGMDEKNIVFSDNPQDVYSMITLFCKAGDAVLLEGRVPKEIMNSLI